jgi:hypothetical protein
LHHELIAVRSLEFGDLQRTVMLQRLVVRTLILQQGQRDAEQRSKAASIWEWLESRDTVATHDFEQLQVGESAMLRLWLLSQPSGSNPSRGAGG